MQRFIFLISVFVQFSIVQAQNSTLTNAVLYRNDGNLTKAKEEIDKACLNEKTMQMPKTWYYKGLIYKEISQSTQPEIQKLDPEALNASFASLKKVSELEVPPGEFVQKANEVLEELWIVYINAGVTNYQNHVFIKALNQFEHAQDIKPKDTTAYIYALYAADEMSNNDLVLRYCDRLTSIGYKSPYVYYKLIDAEFGTLRNPEKAFSMSKKALQEFPNDKNLIEQQTDMLIRMNKSQEALSNLLVLGEKNPTDVQVLINIATQYDKLKDKPNALLYYNKVLKIDSLNYIGNYNMAVYSIQETKSIERKIVSNDSIQIKQNKLYKVTDYTKDPLRVELKNKLDQTKSFYNRAIGNCRDASERKNLDLVLSEIDRLKGSYIVSPATPVKK